MSAVVADTHALIWYLLDPPKLSPKALLAMRQADIAKQIYVPAMALVEMRYLVEKRSILESDFRFVVDAIAKPFSSLHLAPLDFDSAQAVGKITRSVVPDMPDRVIAATALTLGLPLVTCDHKIIASGIPTIW
jgi:PIN domain nuclease of toxin-antitoxin system